MTQKQKELIMLISAIAGGGAMGAMLDKKFGRRTYPYNAYNALYKSSSFNPAYLQILKYNMGIEKDAVNIPRFGNIIKKIKGRPGRLKRISERLRGAQPHIQSVIESTGDIMSTLGSTVRKVSGSWRGEPIIPVKKPRNYAKWLIPGVGAGMLGGAYIHSKLSEPEAP